MTEEEKEEIDQEIRAAYTSGYADGFEVGKKKSVSFNAERITLKILQKKTKN